MTAAERADRTRAADALCQKAYAKVDGPDWGAALVAVGGYGRGELAPHSDLDLVLVHQAGVDLGEVPELLWYPLWDSGFRLDHAVRSFEGMVEAADADVRVASGLLDLRHLAGDPNLTLQLRTTMLANWRRRAAQQLPQLRRIVEQRHELMGELAHSSIPDLKESEGGLRDATVLRGLVATWLIDMPHQELESCRQSLLDVRDLLHDWAGRDRDRIAPEAWSAIGKGLEIDDEREAQMYVRKLGRRLSHFNQIAWRRVTDAIDRTTSPAKGRRPRLEPVGGHVAIARGEVVLDRQARPASDPLLVLRCAAVAAERNLVLAPPTAARLAKEAAPLPDPWPDEARQLMVRLLAAGPGLLSVWETLDETGALDLLLPEWERIRLLPHASVIHRFTVDRHVIETCVEASSLLRQVARPDVLAVAALLHDIGKGGLVEHSRAGEPIARTVAERMGFDADGVDLIARLVRWHLLLSETATSRDPDDPATVQLICSKIETTDVLALLLALTEADARAASAKAWSSWRASLIRDLARRAHTRLDTGSVTPPVATGDMELPDLPEGSTAIEVRTEPAQDGTRIVMIARNRVGLLADMAATLGVLRVSIRAARVWSQGDYGVTVWEVGDESPDPAVLRTRFAAIAEGRLDPRTRLAPAGPPEVDPTVVMRPEASEASTVLEVRAADRPGVMYRVCAALAELDVVVRSAHVDTLGPQAVDVFYIQEDSAGALSDERAAEAAHAVRHALSADSSPHTP